MTALSERLWVGMDRYVTSGNPQSLKKSNDTRHWGGKEGENHTRFCAIDTTPLIPKGEIISNYFEILCSFWNLSRLAFSGKERGPCAHSQNWWDVNLSPLAIYSSEFLFSISAYIWTQREILQKSKNRHIGALNQDRQRMMTTAKRPCFLATPDCMHRPSHPSCHALSQSGSPLRPHWPSACLFQIQATDGLPQPSKWQR